MSFAGQAHAMNAVANVAAVDGSTESMVDSFSVASLRHYTPLSPRCRRDNGWTTPTPNTGMPAAAFNGASYNAFAAQGDQGDGPSESDWKTAPLLPLLPDLISCGEDHDLLDDYGAYDSCTSLLTGPQRGYLPRPRFSPTIVTLPFKAALDRPIIPLQSCNDRFDSFRIDRACESPTYCVDYGPEICDSNQGPFAPLIPLLDSSSPELLLDRRVEYKCFPSVALSMRRATAATVIADQ